MLETTLYSGATIFDGERLFPGRLLVEDGEIAAVLSPEAPAPRAGREIALAGGILAPGFVDLQVNGGGGVLLNDAPTVSTLETIAGAHARLGALTILPTLITDAPAVTARAIAAAIEAVTQGVPGIAGLHLEGPHISLARKGAHDPALIRPMMDEDLEALVAAAARLPCLKITVAPENVTNRQIAALAAAGVLVSLGHSDTSYEKARAAAAAGARLVTHIFNAMSQLGSREPGIVGAALADGGLDAGLIADAVHVHPAVIRSAMAAKTGPGEIFLVSDAMAVAGTDLDRFKLNGRTIRRTGGRLTLADGTLAGADLDLARALRVMCSDVGVARDKALAMATRIPARVMGQDHLYGRLAAGRAADFIHLSGGLELLGVWRRGARIT